MAMQLDIVVSFDDRGSHTIYLDVPGSDFVAVAKRITSEGFLVSAPNPAGGTLNTWYPPAVIKRIEALTGVLSPKKP